MTRKRTPFGPRGRRWAGIGAALSCAAAPALADTYACLLDNGTTVEFTVDRSQFVDAYAPEEPIRRKVTHVRLGAAAFPAEAFLVGDTVGFHGEGLGGSQIIFVARPDGSATLANPMMGDRRDGRCEVLQ